MDYEEVNILIFSLIIATIIGVITSIAATVLLDIFQEHHIPIAWAMVCLIVVLLILWKAFGKKRLEFPNPKEFKHAIEVDMLELAKHILRMRKKRRFFSIWTMFTFYVNLDQDRNEIESIWFDIIKAISAILLGGAVYFLSMRLFGLGESSVFQTIVVFISSAVGILTFFIVASMIHNKIYLPKAFSLHKKARLDINPGTLYDPDVLYLVLDSKSKQASIYYNKEKRKEEALLLVESAEERCSRS